MTAVFYDVENLRDIEHYKLATDKAKEISSSPNTIQSAYAEWGRFDASSKEIFINNGINLKQVVNGVGYFSNIRNAADIAIAVDAIELIFKNNKVNHFILVSGDSGFIALVMKLREYGKRVDLISVENNTNKSILDYVDNHYYLMEKEPETNSASYKENENYELEKETKYPVKPKYEYQHYEKTMWAIFCSYGPEEAVSRLFSNKEIKTIINETGLSISKVRIAYKKTIYKKEDKETLYMRFANALGKEIKQHFNKQNGLIVSKGKVAEISKKEAIAICSEYGLNFSVTNVSSELFLEVIKNKEKYIDLHANKLRNLLIQNTARSYKYADGVAKSISLLDKEKKDLLTLDNYQGVISSAISVFINSASKNKSPVNKNTILNLLGWKR